QSRIWMTPTIPTRKNSGGRIPSPPPRSYCGLPAFINSFRNSMTKSKKDPVRENRISEEVVVDAYGPEEQAMGWYYYLDNKIRFPFRAKCVVSKTVSPLRKGETVEVRRMASEDACAIEMLVMVRWQNRSLVVPLSQLTAIDSNDSTAEAIADWHYWVTQGYT